MITRKRNLAKKKKDEEPPKGLAEASDGTRSKTSSSKAECDGAIEKKNVRFKLCEKDGINDIESNGMNKKSSGRVVRIRVVVTQSQLSQILKESSKYSSSSSSSSVEQLLSTAIMLRNRKISEARTSDGGGGGNGKWKPALDSIQEEH